MRFPDAQVVHSLSLRRRSQANKIYLPCYCFLIKWPLCTFSKKSSQAMQKLNTTGLAFSIESIVGDYIFIRIYKQLKPVHFEINIFSFLLISCTVFQNIFHFNQAFSTTFRLNYIAKCQKVEDTYTARPRDTRILVPEKNRAAQNRTS